MKIKRSVLVCLMLPLLTGCAESVPQNVQSSGIPGQVSPPPAYAERPTYTLNALRARLGDELRQNDSGITIESAALPEADEMPVCSVKIGGAPLDTGYDICKALFPQDNTAADSPAYSFRKWDDPLDASEPAHTQPYAAGDALYAPNISFMDILTFAPETLENRYLIQWDTGFLKASQTRQTSWNDYLGMAQRAPAIRYSRAEAVGKNDVYPMAEGGEWALADAVAYAEAVFRDTLSAADALPLCYTVRDVYVLTLDENRFAYYFTVQMSDSEGRPFDSTRRYQEQMLKRRIESGSPFPMELSCKVYCTGKELLAYVEKSCSFSAITPQQEGAQLLSVTDAAKIIREQLNPPERLRIPCAELCYVLLCEGYPYTKLWNLRTDSSTGFAAAYYPNLCRRSCDFVLRPMWCFRTEDFAELDSAKGFAFYVDAVSGQLYVIRCDQQPTGRSVGLSVHIEDYLAKEELP